MSNIPNVYIHVTETDGGLFVGCVWVEDGEVSAEKYNGESGTSFDSIQDAIEWVLGN